MADEIVNYLESQLPKYLEDLKVMTTVDCGSYTKAGVDKIGGMVQQMVKDMGGEVQVYPQENFGNDVVGKIRGKGKGRIVLLSHMDTVFDEGTCAARPTTIEGNILNSIVPRTAMLAKIIMEIGKRGGKIV